MALTASNVQLSGTDVNVNNVETRMVPFLSSAGAVYLFLCANATNNIQVLKSSDPFGAGFTAVTAATKPFYTGGGQCTQNGDLIYFAGRDSANTGFVLSIFDMSSDTWTTIEQTISTRTANVAVPQIAIGARTDGSLVCIYNSSAASMGSSFDTVNLRTRTTGGTWSAATEIFRNTSSSDQSLPWDVLFGASDLCLLRYFGEFGTPSNEPPLRARSLTSSGTLGAEVTLCGYYGVTGNLATSRTDGFILSPTFYTFLTKVEARTVTIVSTPVPSSTITVDAGAVTTAGAGGASVNGSDRFIWSESWVSASSAHFLTYWEDPTASGTYTKTTYYDATANLHASTTSGTTSLHCGVNTFTRASVARTAFLFRGYDGSTFQLYYVEAADAGSVGGPVEIGRLVGASQAVMRAAVR